MRKCYGYMVPAAWEMRSAKRGHGVVMAERDGNDFPEAFHTAAFDMLNGGVKT